MSGQASAAVKSLVRARARDLCERCGGSLDGWDGASYHHRRIKGMGGDARPETDQAGNLLLLCGSGTTGCHGWVHQGGNRGEALEAGWLVSRFEEDPSAVPVALFLHGWVFIDDAGGAGVPAPGSRAEAGEDRSGTPEPPSLG